MNPSLPIQQQRGVGLVEVLVSVLVLGFGLLGIISLQLFTVKNNQSSLERGMAVVQSHSIIDAMRADRTSAMNDLFDIALNDSPPTGTTFPAVALSNWRLAIQGALGADAKGAVSCNGSLCSVTVQWNDGRVSRPNEDPMKTVTTEVQL